MRLSTNLKLTPEGGSINIYASQVESDQLVLKIEDTGVGIAESDQEIVFEKFRQVGREAGPGAKGTGLGLPIIKELVEMHRGRIWVESELKKGSG